MNRRYLEGNLMVLTGMFGTQNGVLSAPITTTIRAYLSRAAEVAPKDHLNTPLMVFDKKLSLEIYRFLSVLNTNDIKTVRQCLNPEGYTLERIHVHTDGSQLSSALVIYFESCQGDNVDTILV